MRRVVPFLVVCFIVAASAKPTFAQQRLFGLGTEELFEFDTRQASAGRVLGRVPIPLELRPAGPRDAVPVNGGTHLAWVSDQGRGIVLADTRTGALRYFVFPAFFPSTILGTDGNRLVVAGRGPLLERQVLVADVRTGALRFIELGPESASGPLAYAPERDLLFISRYPNPFLDPVNFDVDVMHLSTERILKTLSVSPARTVGIDVNAAGTRLFVSGVGVEYAFDTVSGAMVAVNAVDPAVRSLGLTFDEARNRLLAVGSEGMEAFSMDTLQLLGGTSVPKLRIPNPPGSTFAALSASIDVSPVSATIFAFEGSYQGRPFACKQVNLAAVQVDTGAVRRFVDLTAQGVSDCFINLVRITESLPPTGLTATPVGRRVTLAWKAPVGATRYEVEAGLAPGQAAIALPANDTGLVVDNTPPGVYYVRVRAINEVGRSLPSNEVTIVVQ